VIRSTGVGDVSHADADRGQDVLSKLGARIQHAMRAFTPEPTRRRSQDGPHVYENRVYDSSRRLTSLGIGRGDRHRCSPSRLRRRRGLDQDAAPRIPALPHHKATNAIAARAAKASPLQADTAERRSASRHTRRLTASWLSRGDARSDLPPPVQVKPARQHRRGRRSRGAPPKPACSTSKMMSSRVQGAMRSRAPSSAARSPAASSAPAPETLARLRRRRNRIGL